MPPISASKMTELLLTRRKLFERIAKHVTAKKIQNQIQATGDRMSAHPQVFGMQIGKQMNKQALVTLPASAGIGAGLGLVTSPSGHRMEGAGRGAVKGTGTGVGMIGGGLAGAIGAAALGLLNRRAGQALFGPSAKQMAAAIKRYVARGGRTRMINGKRVVVRMPGRMSPYTDAMLHNAVGRGGAVGATGGGLGGYALTSSLMDAPSWEKKEASVLSVLGGLAGGGLGGLAGGAGGSILGALGGGALGGGPGAGLGLLAGGAAGLGAGAHVGGGIGASIGKSFSKKKEEPKSEKNDDEKTEEKSDDSGDEEVKKSAAAVLAQLQKNAEDPGAQTKAMINGMRQQGIASGQWANNGAGGFTQKNVTYSPAAAAKAQPTPAPTPAPVPAVKPPVPAPQTPGVNVTRMKSRTAF